jgi:polysaccharide export outer membrane protein
MRKVPLRPLGEAGWSPAGNVPSARGRTHAPGCVFALGIVLLTACAARRDGGLVTGDTSGSSPRPTTGLTDLMSVSDHHRLEVLAAERAGEPADGGYRIGPDDLLEIRIPDLFDVRDAVQPPPVGGAPIAALAQAPVFQQGTRVNALGDVTVPLLGTVHAGGLAPSALEQEIAGRLTAKGILRHPQVSVLVVEYRSRVVAVVGSVERPGVYPLTRTGATLADLIWAAGGPNKDAGRLISFVPASGAAPISGAAPDLTRLARGEPIRIDLEILLHANGSDALMLNPQVRPGDLISVSSAGNVHVDGWVEKPGSYPVTRALTLSGAVAAAGGQLFPADCRHVTVKRMLAPGEQRYFVVDLTSVAEGREPDMPIADGDVVRLPASLPRMLPYGVWSLAMAVIHVGASVPLF